MILITEPSSNQIYFSVFRSFDDEHPAALVVKTVEECYNKDILKQTIATVTQGEMPLAISVRILFGGESFDKIIVVNDSFFTRFEELIPHRPYYIYNVLKYIRMIYDLFPQIQILAFFETGFFSSLPEAEKCYAVPEDYFGGTTFRKWGFHGIWHHCNSQMPENPDKTISIVLDKTTTVCALNRNTPVAVSFGSTPLEGIMGEKSCGDIDPGIVFYLMRKLNCSIYKMDNILKMQSGFYGLTGYDLAMDDLFTMYGSDEKIDAAFEMYMNQIKNYIGESCAMLGGLTDIVFSGDHVDLFTPLIFKILKDISFLDIGLCPLPWKHSDKLSKITTSNSKVSVFLNKAGLYEIMNKMTKDFMANHKEVLV